jgi:dihydroorotate dehydrogenase
LIVKLGFLEQDVLLKTVERIARHANGISAVNTLSATIVDPAGRRALGSGAEHGGICGQAIHLPALKMIDALHKARRALGLDNTTFALVGVGGCSNYESLMRFLEAGADVVHAATGAMWHLQLAGECARGLGIPYLNEDIH